MRIELKLALAAVAAIICYAAVPELIELMGSPPNVTEMGVDAIFNWFIDIMIYGAIVAGAIVVFLKSLLPSSKATL